MKRLRQYTPNRRKVQPYRLPDGSRSHVHANLVGAGAGMYAFVATHEDGSVRDYLIPREYFWPKPGKRIRASWAAKDG